MEKRLILVVGSGRSGTSLFTSVLKTLGAHVPQPEIPPDESNPRGFGETEWVVNFHRRALRLAGVHMVDARPSAWAKTAEVGLDPEIEDELRAWLKPELNRKEPVVIKDPRLVWFLPLWDMVATGLGATVSYATMLRPPQEAYQSRQTFYTGRRQPSSAVAGWINTMLHAERATRGTTRSFPRYGALLEDWAATTARVCEELDLPILETTTANQQRAVNQLVDPSLRRSASTWEGSQVHREVSDMADDVWSLFDRLPDAKGAELDEITQALDEARDEYATFYGLVESVAESSIVEIKPPTKNGSGKGKGKGKGKSKGKAKANKRTAAPTLTQRVKRKVKRMVGERSQ